MKKSSTIDIVHSKNYINKYSSFFHLNENSLDSISSVIYNQDNPSDQCVDALSEVGYKQVMENVMGGIYTKNNPHTTQDSSNVNISHFNNNEYKVQPSNNGKSANGLQSTVTSQNISAKSPPLSKGINKRSRQSTQNNLSIDHSLQFVRQSNILIQAVNNNNVKGDNIQLDNCKTIFENESDSEVDQAIEDVVPETSMVNQSIEAHNSVNVIRRPAIRVLRDQRNSRRSVRGIKSTVKEEVIKNSILTTVDKDKMRSNVQISNNISLGKSSIPDPLRYSRESVFSKTHLAKLLGRRTVIQTSNVIVHVEERSDKQKQILDDYEYLTHNSLLGDSQPTTMVDGRTMEDLSLISEIIQKQILEAKLQYHLDNEDVSNTVTARSNIKSKEGKRSAVKPSQAVNSKSKHLPGWLSKYM